MAALNPAADFDARADRAAGICPPRRIAVPIPSTIRSPTFWPAFCAGAPANACATASGAPRREGTSWT